LLGDYAVSVIVPARNEQATIRPLLDSLLNQTNKPAEIIVVDAGSDDHTAQIVHEYGQATVPVRLIRSTPVFPGTARNIGVAYVLSEYVAFTDAGITLDPVWLEQLTAALKRSETVDVVFGSYCPVTSTFFAKCAAIAYVPARSGERLGNIRGPTIVSCLLRKSVFDAVGGFPPYRAAEDLMFIEKLMRGGNYRIAYAPGAVARWSLANGWSATYRRFAMYSYHNLIAGRGRYWHYGVGRLYALALPFLLLARFHNLLWLAVPAAGLGARTAVTIWRKRKERWGGLFHPIRWITVASILLLLDAATFSGAIWWGLNKLRGRLPLTLLPDQEELV
jgi:glycosyltransferase involved in cell wall biosynthesis